uniref:Uncharacterized protein n=1 Tax=Poecilia latipinna TaxID=48699 RepID=A0A3B3VRE9_9TELE
SEYNFFYIHFFLSLSCPMCSNSNGLIRKYRLNMYRQCFTQYVKNIGCVKLELC